jgi:peptidoglycan/xylan/chitin deacetylase (PgdA/CDA1 family)
MRSGPEGSRGRGDSEQDTADAVSSRRGIKRFVAGVLTSDPVTTLLKPLMQSVACILMLHRFADPDRGNTGHQGQALRAQLAYLRRKRYEVVALEELTRRLQSHDTRLSRTVAFTIDDGYADYATIGTPVFEEFDCPATVFLVTGVVDARGWYWWDRLRVLLETAVRRSLAIEVGGMPMRMEWSDIAGAGRAARAFVERLKFVPDGERRRILDALPAVVEADVPATPPPQYGSMTWDEIHTCGRGVTTVGAHTVTHPILARTDDLTARSEITTSWQRVRTETDAAVPVFCYPNGRPSDVTSREIAALEEPGLTAAVTASSGYASLAAFNATPTARVLMPRFPYTDNPNGFVQLVSGVHRVKRALRGNALS